MQRSETPLWPLFVVGLIAGAALDRACMTCEADAQDGPRPTLTAHDREDVARCLVAEAAPGPDYPAILTVLSRRSSSLAWAARNYCAVWVAHRPSPRQLAIRALPGGPSARIYAAHWRAALAAVDAWQRGERVPCDADHFGDRAGDSRRARRAGWTPVDCGRTANGFWRLPRAVRADVARGRGGRR